MTTDTPSVDLDAIRHREQAASPIRSTTEIANNLDLDSILTDAVAHAAELPVDVVDCVGCHIAVTDAPRMVTAIRELTARIDAAHSTLSGIEGVDEESTAGSLEAAVEHVAGRWLHLAASEAQAADEIDRLRAENAAMAADVRLLAQRYADLKTAALATGNVFWERKIAEIEDAPLRCSHGIPVDDDCRQCMADVMAQIQQPEVTR